MSTSELSDIFSGFNSSFEAATAKYNGTGSVRLRLSQGSEGRRQIPSRYLESVSSHASLVDNANYLNSQNIWYNVPEPLDIEQEIEAQVDAVKGEEEEVRTLADFPFDDVKVVTEERQYRTLQPSVPKDLSNLPSHLYSCMESFTQDYCTVERNYKNLGSGKLAFSHKDNVQEVESQLPKQMYEEDEEEVETPKLPDTPKARESWAESVIDLKNSQADSLIPNILDSVPQDEIDEKNNQERTKDRFPNIFPLYTPLNTPSNQASGNLEDSDFPVENIAAVLPPSEQFGYRLLIKCLTLSMEVDIEPIFATVALYDTKYKKKISENFHFDLNSDATKKMMKLEGVHPSISTLARSAMFSLTYPSQDVFIVIKLEKVLQQGDIAECAEPYLKDATDKSREKARQSAKWFCERLGKYRMPFAWTAIHLMNIVNSATHLRPVEENNSSNNEDKTASLDSQQKQGTLARKYSLNESELNMLSSFKPVTLTISSFFKQEGERLKDEDLYKFLMDLKRPSNTLKRLKCIPCNMKVDVSPCPPTFQYCITPDLQRVKPYPDQRGRPTREIQEFPALDIANAIPNTIYRNLLYVSPTSVNFTTRPSHARNISIKVQLLESEDPSNALPLIYGKSNCPEFTSEAYTIVTYHNKSPDFYDEIKIQLPAKLTTRHHILFSFFHISCQKKQDLTPIETAVGYTWIPLLHNGRLQTGELQLPVSADRLPTHYSMHSSDVQLSGVKWFDGHKPIFNVTLQAVSTVHMFDKSLENFFALCDMVDTPATNGLVSSKLPDGTRVDDVETSLRKSIILLANESSLRSLVRFLYVVLNKLVKMLVRPPVINGLNVNIGQCCFEAITKLSNRLHDSADFNTDSHQRNVLLATYSKYLFNIPVFAPNVDGENNDSNFKGAHYATMTRQEKRHRPSISEQTFHISNSNPDLSVPNSPDFDADEPTTNGDRSFLRMSVTRSSLMEQSSKKEGSGLRSVSQKLFHEEIVLLLVVSKGTSKELALKRAWFVFELITKSMAKHLEQTGLIAASRADRFPARYCDDLKRLVKMVTLEICQRFNRDYDFTERLNLALTFLMMDLLSIMDRGFVFQLVHAYFDEMNDKMSSLIASSPSSLLQLRLTFLRVLSSHEHFITLNLPFCLPPTPSSPSPSIGSTVSSTSYLSSAISKGATRYDLSERFTRQHYLSGLLLSDIKLTVDLIENSTTSMGKVQLYAVTILKNLMSSHDADPRINGNSELKRTVAALYLPLVSIAIKALPFACTFADKTTNSALNEDGTVSSSLASAIAGTAVKSNTPQMSPQCTKTLLVCLLWLLKNTEREVLRSWWVMLQPSQIISILDLLYISLSCFEYKAGYNPLLRSEVTRSSIKGPKKKDHKSRLQEAILGGSSARNEMLMRRRGGGATRGGGGGMGTMGDKSATLGGLGAQKDVLRWRKDKTEWKQAKQDEKMKQSSEDSSLGRNFAAESSLIILDTLELIIETATESNESSRSQILYCALRVLLHCFSKKQSVAVLQHLFNIQRAMVAKFPELIFENETEQCADLSLKLLEKCSSNHSSVRQHASASLYMLMRHNFSMGNNFARVKMQVTMSMSSLVGVHHDFEEESLRRSLKTILSYAEIDSDLEGTSFREQVRDLVFNLNMILSDTVKMKAHQEDPEMLIDLMYRIAKGYQTSPDLRLTWLQNMARQHSDRKNHAEAGMCLVHCAALVAEYLFIMERKAFLPVGSDSFKEISNNVLEESAVSDDVVTQNAEEICSEKYFSVTGITALLEQAAVTFTQAGLHEVVDMIYKLVIPICSSQKDFKKIASIHSKLQECFTKISSQSGHCEWETGKRMFGTYFRVAFYGYKFGDLNGEEFVYKEPAITKLPEISLRLENFYTQCFGSVEMVKDSSNVDTDTLDPQKAYIQITYVEPYFYQYEEERKISYFERNFNIDKFMYATPFTKDGKAHGEMREQFKRKTFLQVSHTFPYVKTRINVIKRWEEVLTPLEAACEDVNRKASELIKQSKMKPPDLRMLQINLQGAVLTSVNQGPMEVANTFLTEIPDSPKQFIPYNELRLAFKKFDYACSIALKKNKTLISADQKEYQREMEKNYHKMSEQLRQMYGDKEIVMKILNMEPSLGILMA